MTNETERMYYFNNIHKNIERKTKLRREFTDYEVQVFNIIC